MSTLPPPSSPPPPGPPQGAPAPKGGTLVKSAWTALRADKELLGLPILGGVVSLVAVVPVLVMLALVPSDAQVWYYVIGVLAAFIVAVISTFFAVALAVGAHDRMGGGQPTFKSCCAVAWSHKRGVIGWALLSTTVGLVLNLIEEKMKGAGGAIVRLIGDMAWAVASFFAIPIIAANDVGPIEALKLSTSTFKSRWGSAVRVQLRLGIYGIGLFVLAIVGFFLVAFAWQASHMLGIALGIVVIIGLMIGVLLLSAIGAYARVALYRYASGLVTPGFTSATMDTAITPKVGTSR